MFWVEIHVVLVRVSEIDLGVVLGSKLTWICVRAKTGLVFSVGFEFHLVFMLLVEMNLISVLGIEIDLISE